MAYTTLRFELRANVARITLDRQPHYNALDLAMAEELCDVANRCATDAAVRAVLLTGAGGKAFCAGGDVAGFAAAGDDVALLIHRMTGALHSAISRLVRGRAPVVVAVNGVAAGAGLSMAIFGDLVLASETASFTSAYTKIGLTPDGSSTWFLPRLVGPRRAAELYLTNRVLSAAEALEWGLVNRVLPAAELMPAAEALAGQLAEGPTEAFGATRRLLRLSQTESLESQMEHETQAIAAMSGTADGREGVAAFLARRKPMFRGM